MHPVGDFKSLHSQAVLIRLFPHSSGLKGIDFGSFPLISKWVKEVINSSLADYIFPHYVSIDIPTWLNGTTEDIVVRYFDLSRL